MKKPVALLIAPPVYDFALYDLYLKPLPLLRIGFVLRHWGYEVELVNALDYTTPVRGVKKPRRKEDGTGKFYRSESPTPDVLSVVERRYARYGLPEELLRSRIAAVKPDMVLVTGGMTYWYPGVREVIRHVRELHPGIPVVAGGVYPTLCPDHCLDVCGADHVVQGDAFPELNKILEMYALPQGPMPDEGIMIRKEIYGDAGVLLLNRGCPFRCRYCSSFRLSGPFVKGDPQSSFCLVKRIHEELGTLNFAFYDDALLVNKEEILIPFLQKIIASGYPFRFYLPNAIHVAFINEEVAVLMKRAGFRELRIGFESVSRDFHDAMDNKFDISIFGEKIDILKNAGFSSQSISLYILAGLPGQRKEEVEESIRYASTFGVNVYLAEYSPVPGSLLWEESVARSSFPVAEEPLTHNNSILPLRWEHFTMEDLSELKQLALTLCRKRTPAGS